MHNAILLFDDEDANIVNTVWGSWIEQKLEPNELNKSELLNLVENHESQFFFYSNV